jgi:hypothetical protein
MSEIQALILTVGRGMVALVAILVLIEVLGGSFDLMALVIVFFMCAIPWSTAGVVMRYAHRRDDP